MGIISNGHSHPTLGSESPRAHLTPCVSFLILHCGVHGFQTYSSSNQQNELVLPRFLFLCRVGSDIRNMCCYHLPLLKVHRWHRNNGGLMMVPEKRLVLFCVWLNNYWSLGLISSTGFYMLSLYYYDKWQWLHQSGIPTHTLLVTLVWAIF